MKISFVAPRGMSGGARVYGIHADRLTGAGHEVTVVSGPPALPPFTRKIKDLLLVRGWPRPHQQSHLDHLQFRHRALSRWRPIADRDDPDGDIVVATWWETAEWVARLSPSKGARAYFVQLEAIACRCPVVSTRCGGPQDVVSNGVNGFLVDVGDADALARRALDVLRLPEDRWRAMSDAA